MRIVVDNYGPQPGDLDEYGNQIDDRWAHLDAEPSDYEGDWTPPPDTEIDDYEAEVHDLDLDNLLEVIDPSEWADNETPQREWLLSNWIPARQMTFLTGAGAAGKSLLTQQLCTCVAMGKPFLGVSVAGTRALYITCEDDYDELHRRQKSICNALNISLPYLSGRLYLMSLMGAVGNELATFDEAGRMRTTEAWTRLLHTVRARKIGFLVLDNVAHLFTGNENIRNQVAAFCGLLNKLASETGCAIVLIGHPNKAGNDYSGSTAWENQVRSRLFLKIPKEEDGAILNPDVRVLENGKANYSKNGQALEFRWHEMAFLLESEVARDIGDEALSDAQDRADDERFLRCLRELNRQERPCSEHAGRNYAPFLMARLPESARIGKRRLEAAMERLFRAGKIRTDEVGKYAKGKPIIGLVITNSVSHNAPTTPPVFPQRPRGRGSHNGSHNDPTTPTTPKGQAAHNAAHNAPYIPKGILPPADAAPPGAGDISNRDNPGERLTPKEGGRIE